MDKLNTKQMASVENSEVVVAVPTLLRSGCWVSVELGSIWGGSVSEIVNPWGIWLSAV